MKYLIPFLLVFSSVAFAGGDRPERGYHKHYDVQLQGQAQQQQQKQQVKIYNYDKGKNVDYKKLQMQHRTVAASAASIDLAYCSDAGSAQSEHGGLGFGQMNYICEAVAALKVTLLLIEMELAAAGLDHSSDSPDWVHVNKAHEYMMDAEGIMKDVVDYIDARDDTAGIAAMARDVTWPLILLGILLAL